jgi:hypothetical protein
VPCASVAELVRDHELDLARLAVGEQAVEEHDAPGRAKARDVGVLPARPAARVGDQHISNRHTRALGEGPPARSSSATTAVNSPNPSASDQPIRRCTPSHRSIEMTP